MPGSSPFSYSVYRLVPRVERGERINVGVVVFSRPLDFLAARTGLDGERVRALWPDARSGRRAAAPGRTRAHRCRRRGRRADRGARHHRALPLARGAVQHDHPALRGAHRPLRRAGEELEKLFRSLVLLAGE